MKKIINIFFIIVVVIAGCNSGPKPINYGTDLCSMCRMKIMDTKFGAEVVNYKGKVYKFDCDECLIDYLNTGTLKPDQKGQFLVTDYYHQGNLIDAEKAFYLYNEKVPSPMGASISSYLTKEDAEKINTENGNAGVIVGWEAIQQLRNKK